MISRQLAQKLGVAVTVVSDMENNRRAVSRKMAVKLADVFGSDPAAYFRFKREVDRRATVPEKRLFLLPKGGLKWKKKDIRS